MLVGLRGTKYYWANVTRYAAGNTILLASARIIAACGVQRDSNLRFGCRVMLGAEFVSRRFRRGAALILARVVFAVPTVAPMQVRNRERCCLQKPPKNVYSNGFPILAKIGSLCD